MLGLTQTALSLLKKTSKKSLPFLPSYSLFLEDEIVLVALAGISRSCRIFFSCWGCGSCQWCGSCWRCRGNRRRSLKWHGTNFCCNKSLAVRSLDNFAQAFLLLFCHLSFVISFQRLSSLKISRNRVHWWLWKGCLCPLPQTFLHLHSLQVVLFYFLGRQFFCLFHKLLLPLFPLCDFLLFEFDDRFVFG